MVGGLGWFFRKGVMPKEGELYDATDPRLRKRMDGCVKRKAVLDAVPMSDPVGRLAALTALVGSVKGMSIVTPPFIIEFGDNLHLGEWVFVNAGCTFLDSAKITLGDHVAVGPNVQFITASHPKRPEDRIIMTPGAMPPFKVMTTARPIVVGAHAWIGAGAIILPGITVGEGAVVGAGSVVTKDVPPRRVVAGNPASVIGLVDTT